MEALETKNLTKQFGGVKAVDGLSITLQRGAITGIIGPNGSGKTTLINVLTGMLPADGGVVEVRDVQLSKMIPRDVPVYGMTRTFQTIRLFEQMTVLDNILVVLTERGVTRSLFERYSEFHLQQAEDVLKRVGLWEKRNDLAHNLSYGQRKLLEIARAIAMDVDLYLLDEPFAGLFPEMVKTVTSIVKELREHGNTVVLIEHNIDLIRELCDHVFVLDTGKLLASGKPNDVLAKKEVIEAYLGN